MPSIKDTAITGIKWQSISAAFVSVAKLLQVVIITRFIEKEELGLIGIAILLNGFCTIFVDMGMASAVLHSQILSKSQFSSFYWLNVLSGVFFTILIITLSPFIANYYNQDVLVSIISYTSLLIFFNSLYALQRTMQQKRMNFRFISIVEICSSILMLVLNFIFCILGFGIYSYVWSSLAGSIFHALLYMYQTLIKDRDLNLHLSILEIKDGLKIGIYQVGTSTLDYFSREMDSLIISSAFSMELFGVYTICKQLASRLYMFINPIVTSVLTPVLATMQNDRNLVTHSYIKVVNFLGFVNFPIYSIVAFGATSLLFLLYGPSYEEYGYILFFMASFYAFQSLGNPQGSLLVATGRTDLGFYWTIFRIFFTSIYLYLACRFDFTIFCFLVFCQPILTIFPSWLICFKNVINISFKDNVMLFIRPFLICAPMAILYFFPKASITILGCEDTYFFHIISLLIIVSIFIPLYVWINYIFRHTLILSVWSEISNGFLQKHNMQK